MTGITIKNGLMLRYLREFGIAIVICALLAVTVDYICFLFIGETSAGTWYDKYWMGFFFCCAFVVSSFVILRNKLGDKPEYLYLILVLAISLYMTWSLSLYIVGWDTGIHFRNVLGWADIDDQFELSRSELAYITTSLLNDDGSGFPMSLEGTYQMESWLNGNNSNIQEIRPAYSFWKVATAIEYLPCSAVMIFCELLDAPFTTSHFLSLLPSILIYSFVTFAGMKKLQSGKALYGVICLLPTAVFLVSNYGYQYWNMSFFLYGFACLASFLQRREVVPLKSIILMIVAFFLASLPRLAYAPLILLSLLVPKCCFKSGRISRIYRVSIVLATIIAASIYLIPLLQSGFGEGDVRGGSDIDPAAQLAFILSDPVAYIKRLIRFFAPPYTMMEDGANIASGYLTPSASIRFIGFYAYLGYIPYPLFLTLIALLAFLTISDTNRNLSYGPVPAIACISVSLIIIIAITTALYLDFNNVGENAFRGVQARYLLPFIFPALAFLGSNKWNLNGTRIPSSIYNGGALAVVSGVVLASWWIAYVCKIY